MNRLPTEFRQGAASVLGHTLPVSVLDNGEVGVFRTQKNGPQQKENQVSRPRILKKKHGFHGNIFSFSWWEWVEWKLQRHKYMVVKFL
jgi:hypothetical protein